MIYNAVSFCSIAKWFRYTHTQTYMYILFQYGLLQDIEYRSLGYAVVVQFLVAQSLSHVWLIVTPCTEAHQAPPSSTIFWSLPKFRSIESVMLSNPSLFCLQSFPASGYFPISQLFPMDGQSIGTSASATNLPMNIQGWFPLGLAGLILLQSKELSVIQRHNSKASILWFSTFLIIQLSHPYMTTEKTITLTIQIFVNKVISLLFNMLSRFVIASFKGESVF